MNEQQTDKTDTLTPHTPETLEELCRWPRCENPALCRSGNYGDKLVCAEHFKITNGTAARENYDSHNWVGVPSQSVGDHWPTDPISVCSECGIEDLGDPDEFPDLQYPNCNNPEEQPRPTLSIPLKYCTFEVWADQRTAATVFPRGETCVGARIDTEQNRTEAESQGYTGHDRVWRSLVEHELLHNVIAEVMFDRHSLVMATESGLRFYPSWLRYEEEAIVLAYQYFINTGNQPEMLYKYPQGVYEVWKREYAPRLEELWK